jgi:hypothetical protein
MLAEQNDGCVPWQSGDIVHFGKDEKKAVVLGHAPRVRHYHLELLEGHLKGIRNWYIDTDIIEGPCKEGGYAAVLPQPVPMRPPPRPSKLRVPEDEFKRFKDIINALFVDLPEEPIRKFVTTPDYEIFRKVLEDGESPEERRKFVAIVDGLLAELPREKIVKFVKTADYEVYKSTIQKHMG